MRKFYDWEYFPAGYVEPKSKSYFAKYLPVEGEIKEGDYWQHSNGAIFPWTEHYAKGPIASLKPKKVKLFLCSRDIEVGDLVTDFHHIEPAEHEANEDCSKEGCIKVIGEISPKATWVKEGDEFDKSDLSMLVRYNYGQWSIGEHRAWCNPEELLGTNIFVGNPPNGLITKILDTTIFVKCKCCGKFS